MLSIALQITKVSCFHIVVINNNHSVNRTSRTVKLLIKLPSIKNRHYSMAFELSAPVLQGLQNLGTEIPLDLAKKLIANSLKLTLAPEATVPSAPEIYTSNAEKVKQSEYAVVTLIVLATKHCCDPLSLRQILEKHSVHVAAIEELTRVYEDHRKDLLLRQLQLGTSFPHITDVQWRIVADVRSSTSGCSSGEIGFHINLGRYHQSNGQRETIVEFLCNTEELQSLINKLKEIERHCEKIANE